MSGYCRFRIAAKPGYLFAGPMRDHPNNDQNTSLAKQQSTDVCDHFQASIDF